MLKYCSNVFARQIAFYILNTGELFLSQAIWKISLPRSAGVTQLIVFHNAYEWNSRNGLPFLCTAAVIKIKTRGE